MIQYLQLYLKCIYTEQFYKVKEKKGLHCFVCAIFNKLYKICMPNTYSFILLTYIQISSSVLSKAKD